MRRGRRCLHATCDPQPRQPHPHTEEETTVPATTGRPLWRGIPANARTAIEALVGGHVIHAQNCPGGFSPGLASRLTLSDGRRVFVKAMDADAWPDEAAI